MPECVGLNALPPRARRLAPVLAAAVLAALAAAWTTAVRAGDDLDVTMTVIEDNDSNIEHEVTKHITLPPKPDHAEQGERGGDAPGRGVADDARERGRDFGQSTAEGARSRRGPPADRPGNGGGGNPPDNPGSGKP